MDVIIKHEQIFNNNCYLIAVSCFDDDTGKTLNELIAEMSKDEKYFNNLNFNINLSREIKRISSEDAKNIRLTVNSIKIFDCKKINPFKDIPEEVSNLSYKMNIVDCKEISLEDENILINEY